MVKIGNTTFANDKIAENMSFDEFKTLYSDKLSTDIKKAFKALGGKFYSKKVEKVKKED